MVFDLLSSFFHFEMVLLCHPGWSAVVQTLLTAASTSWVQVIPLPQPPELLGLAGMCYQARLIFVFLVEMGFHRVAQAVLRLLTSGDPHISAPQSAAITSMRHRTAPGQTLVDADDELYVLYKDDVGISPLIFFRQTFISSALHLLCLLSEVHLTQITCCIHFV